MKKMKSLYLKNSIWRNCAIILFGTWMLSLQSCSDSPYKDLYGDWQIEEMHHQGKDICNPNKSQILTNSFLLMLQKDGILTIDDMEGKVIKPMVAEFRLFKKGHQLQMDIYKSNNNILNGNYDIDVDTIQETPLYLSLKMIADSEETYFIAYRNKRKQ